MFKEAGQEQLKPLLGTILDTLVQSLASTPEDADEAQAAVNEALQTATMTVEDFLYEEIHLSSGWPLDWSFSREGNIRIDTHRDNKIMQHNILKYGFSYCGIIYLLSGDERLAYQSIR